MSVDLPWSGQVHSELPDFPMNGEEGSDKSYILVLIGFSPAPHPVAQRICRCQLLPLNWWAYLTPLTIHMGMQVSSLWSTTPNALLKSKTLRYNSYLESLDSVTSVTARGARSSFFPSVKPNCICAWSKLIRAHTACSSIFFVFIKNILFLFVLTEHHGHAVQLSKQHS